MNHPHQNEPEFHPLQDPWPPFLDLLETDPPAAQDGLWRFLCAMLQTRHPRVYRSCTRELQEEIRHAVFVHLCENHFARLRGYANRGRSFAGWLAVVVHHKAVDMLPAPVMPPPVEDQTANDDLSSETRILIAQMADRLNHHIENSLTPDQRLLARLAAEGLRPREIAGLFERDNVSLGNELAYIRKKLRRLLKEDGFDPDDYSDRE